MVKGFSGCLLMQKSLPLKYLPLKDHSCVRVCVCACLCVCFSWLQQNQILWLYTQMYNAASVARLVNSGSRVEELNDRLSVWLRVLES